MNLDFAQAFTERTPRVVNAAKLLKTAGRRKANLFLAEGENAVEAAVSTGAAQDVFVTEKASQRFSDLLIAAGHMNVYVHPITDKAASSLSDTVTTTGIFAVCKPVLWPLRDVMRAKPQLLMVAVETSEPGNAGTLIRVADAVGADAVLFAGETVDPQGPKAVRASAGSLFHIPVIRETNFQTVFDSLKARDLQIIATTPTGELSLDEADELLARPTAWLFGNEAHGLPAEVLAKADITMRIPIRGRAESLNLATAASICMYESAKVQNR